MALPKISIGGGEGGPRANAIVEMQAFDDNPASAPEIARLRQRPVSVQREALYLQLIGNGLDQESAVHITRMISEPSGGLFSAASVYDRDDHVQALARVSFANEVAKIPTSGRGSHRLNHAPRLRVHPINELIRNAEDLIATQERIERRGFLEEDIKRRFVDNLPNGITDVQRRTIITEIERICPEPATGTVIDIVAINTAFAASIATTPTAGIIGSILRAHPRELRELTSIFNEEFEIRPRQTPGFYLNVEDVFGRASGRVQPRQPVVPPQPAQSLAQPTQPVQPPTAPTQPTVTAQPSASTNLRRNPRAALGELVHDDIRVAVDNFYNRTHGVVSNKTIEAVMGSFLKDPAGLGHLAVPVRLLVSSIHENGGMAPEDKANIFGQMAAKNINLGVFLSEVGAELTRYIEQANDTLLNPAGRPARNAQEITVIQDALDQPPQWNRAVPLEPQIYTNAGAYAALWAPTPPTMTTARIPGMLPDSYFTAPRGGGDTRAMQLGREIENFLRTGRDRMIQDWVKAKDRTSERGRQTQITNLEGIGSMNLRFAGRKMLDI